MELAPASMSAGKGRFENIRRSKKWKSFHTESFINRLKEYNNGLPGFSPGDHRKLQKPSFKITNSRITAYQSIEGLAD